MTRTDRESPRRTRLCQAGSLTRKVNDDDPLRIHESQKPLPLLFWLIQTYSNPGDIVLDPFAGSFGTVVAAKQLGRQAVGFDNQEDHCVQGLERIRYETAQINMLQALAQIEGAVGKSIGDMNEKQERDTVEPLQGRFDRSPTPDGIMGQ